jgi:hypothetical protein
VAIGPRPRSGPSRRDAQYLGIGFTPAPVVQPTPTPMVVPGYAPPPDKHEFICGVWSGDDDDQ